MTRESRCVRRCCTGWSTRAEEQIARLNRELGSDTVFRRCGSALSSQAVGPKLAWISERQPGCGHAPAASSCLPRGSPTG